MPRAIATADRVSRAQLVAFLRVRHHAILMTTRASAGPQMSPVACGVDESGRLVVSTYPDRAKAVNARRHSAVSACVLSDDFGGPWVQVDGIADVIDVPESVEPLVEYYRSISGEHPDWDDYRAAMIHQGKSLIRVTIEAWGPIATGGFPGRLANS
ncbi:MAG: PPOX class F420-dependent oxidoreductase [Cellulomonas sp.]